MCTTYHYIASIAVSLHLHTHKWTRHIHKRNSFIRQKDKRKRENNVTEVIHFNFSAALYFIPIRIGFLFFKFKKNILELVDIFFKCATQFLHTNMSSF